MFRQWRASDLGDEPVVGHGLALRTLARVHAVVVPLHRGAVVRAGGAVALAWAVEICRAAARRQRVVATPTRNRLGRAVRA
eukprot:1117782-Rhodomonas_salina.1